MEHSNTPQSITPPTFLVVVPVFNHSHTLRQVVEGVLAMHPHVLVVDDGSTDMPALPGAPLHATTIANAAHPLHGLCVHYLRHEHNKGKGVAITTAAAAAAQLGFSHIVTIDADAQHNPQELPVFFAACQQNPLAIVVGTRNFATENVPASSRFGRAFSNFWFKLQTGHPIGDSQSGFRAYPLAILQVIHCAEAHYSFEIEVLVRAAWAGFAVVDVPISVHYPPQAQRVSHFKPLLDNIRISLLNTRLTFRSLMPWPHKKYVPTAQGTVTALHPLRSLRLLLSQNETPGTLALSASLGIFLGTVPLIALHSIAIVLVAGAMRLNKIMGLAASQLCIPPFVPALCIMVGYYVRNGRWLTEFSLQTLGYQAFERIIDWAVGSVLVAPALALLVGGVTFALSKWLQLTLVRNTAQYPEQPPKQPEQGSGKSWSSKSLASQWQHRIFYLFIRWGGWRLAYAALFFVVSWYWCLPSVQKRSLPYLQRRFPHAGRVALARHRWQMQWHFGKTLVDRATAGIQGVYTDTASADDKNTLLALRQENKGLIFITAHVGPWHTIMMGLQDVLGEQGNVVMHKDAQNVDKDYFEHNQRMLPFRIIDPQEGPASSMAMVLALQRGEVVAFMGDRPFGNPKHVVPVPFLGENIPVPWGAYYLASITQAPVVICFTVRTGPCTGHHYIAKVLRVPENLGKKMSAYAPYASVFVQTLEQYVQEHPYQFFNFYNMWETSWTTGQS